LKLVSGGEPTLVKSENITSNDELFKALNSTDMGSIKVRDDNRDLLSLSHFSRANGQQKLTHAGGVASRVTTRPLE
jgi:hypothetical protein